MQKPFNGGKRAFAANGAEATGHRYEQIRSQMNLNLSLTPLYKKTKMDHRLQILNYKAFRKKNLWDLGLNRVLLRLDTKSPIHKRKN